MDPILSARARLSLYLTRLLLGRDVVLKRVLYVLRQAAPILLGQLLQRVFDVRTYAEGNDGFLGHLGRPIVDTGKPSMPMMPISMPMMPMPRLSTIP